MKTLLFCLSAMLLLLTGARADSAAALSTSVVQTIALWPDAAPGMTNPPPREVMVDDGRNFTQVSRPTITAFLSSHANGAAVLVIPGGGYKKVVYEKEGSEIARWLNGLGIDAYVLKYRLPAETFNPVDAAFQDGQRAMRLIRSNALGGEYGHNTDPKRIGVIGFSAGGHLAGVLGTYYARQLYKPVDATDKIDARPDFMILGYPSIFMQDEMKVPFGDRFWDISSPFPFDTAVTAQTPPAFVFVGEGDTRLPYQRAIRTAEVLKKAGVAAELHVFPGAPHGFGLRGTGPEKDWPALCAAWLRGRGIIP